MNIHIATNTTASNTPLLQIAHPAWLLRIEGAILLGGAVWLYAIHRGNLLLFALLLFALTSPCSATYATAAWEPSLTTSLTHWFFRHF